MSVAFRISSPYSSSIADFSSDTGAGLSLELRFNAPGFSFNFRFFSVPPTEFPKIPANSSKGFPSDSSFSSTSRFPKLEKSGTEKFFAVSLVRFSKSAAWLSKPPAFPWSFSEPFSIRSSSFPSPIRLPEDSFFFDESPKKPDFLLEAAFSDLESSEAAKFEKSKEMEELPASLSSFIPERSHWAKSSATSSADWYRSESSRAIIFRQISAKRGEIASLISVGFFGSPF